jgi:(4-(4-[2-(gamma-L-glutamylamino)ethyl]phenoxymethyl)furan-2-yl)methanamine synthase
MSKALSKPQFALGWDIGGAHLKAVLLDAKGNYIASTQLACPLWRGLDFLERVITEVRLQMRKNVGLYNIMHAVTMTGELVDLFENRHQGVCEIANVACKMLGDNVHFYAADNCEIEQQPNFVRQFDVPRFASTIASANWHASASFLAQHVPNALLIDIGSTTTDIIAIEGGKVVSAGISDAYRMQADSLVYTGVVRTPVMALAQKLPFDDGDEMLEVNVAAELFATMADVYRLTGELTADDADTADGKGKTQLESARRLARMIGRDVDKNLENKEMEKWIKLAFACRNMQMQQIKSAMQKQLKPNMTIIGAGAGSFLVKAMAADFGYPFMHAYEPIAMRPTGYIDLSMQQAIEVCFPAYAVAQLRVKSLPC